MVSLLCRKQAQRDSGGRGEIRGKAHLPRALVASATDPASSIAGFDRIGYEMIQLVVHGIAVEL